MRIPKRNYTIATKLKVLALLETSTDQQVSDMLSIPRRTIRTWVNQKRDILAYNGNKKRMKVDPGGRPEEFPDPEGLVDYINQMRAQERALTTSHIINWIKRHQAAWLRSYIARKKPGYQGLLRLLQRFCHRHGFTRQRPGKQKHKQSVLIEVRDDFAAEFHRQYHGFGPDCVYNVDETGFYYDMPPKYIWSARGGDAKISTGEKHSMRMTTVLTVRSNGDKLPILFIIRGTPGGRIETSELPTYPSGHFYAVQGKAWMDNTVWKSYLRDLLHRSLVEPSVILLDNFESHVNDASYRIVEGELGSFLCAIPPNATSICQPLDVGVMAPFKRYLRDEWLTEEMIDGEDGDDFDTPTAAEKRKAMVKRAIAAWDRVTATEIRNSFVKALPSIEE
ncbi:hypothetical protein DYB30_000467 [Aphanomyces astaci]|uniref:DDE-1 domain-containing protein n=2 Tax=Aphanomyces astaci TaxID=112090 RepID=A0A397C4E8_APHAT|nr:hypothetical protein DYB30_000467 [Aphanomyces astaci]RHZ03913.1 hypothetical protein DYB31_003914 [Aphanomyces astaci]